MGIKNLRSETPAMLDALFGKTQQRVLSLLTSSPESRFFQQEIIESARSGSGAVQRELLKLVKAGLVLVETEGSLKRYQINRDSPVFEELRSIFEKTLGLAEPLRKALKPIARRISFAFIYGSVAKGTDKASSDLDLIVVSDHLNLGEVYKQLMPVERRLKRTINLTLYSEAEFEKEKQFSFLKSVLAGKRIVLIGENSNSENAEQIGL